MQKRTVETAAMAFVVASLVVGIYLTMPSTEEFGNLDTRDAQARVTTSTTWELLKQPQRF